MYNQLHASPLAARISPAISISPVSQPSTISRTSNASHTSRTYHISAPSQNKLTLLLPLIAIITIAIACVSKDKMYCDVVQPLPNMTIPNNSPPTNIDIDNTTIGIYNWLLINGIARLVLQIITSAVIAAIEVYGNTKMGICKSCAFNTSLLLMIASNIFASIWSLAGILTLSQCHTMTPLYIQIFFIIILIFDICVSCYTCIAVCCCDPHKRD